MFSHELFDSCRTELGETPRRVKSRIRLQERTKNGIVSRRFHWSNSNHGGILLKVKCESEDYAAMGTQISS